MARRSPKTPNMKPPPNFGPLSRVGLSGAGAVVAVVDSGFDATVRRGIPSNHFKDYTLPGGTAFDSTVDRHGTTVLGIIRRYAPMATIYGAKVGTSVDDIDAVRTTKALEWAALQGANIINVSLGFPVGNCLTGTCPLCEMVQALSVRGVQIVVAEGNRREGVPGGTAIRCPAISEHALTVGALDVTGTELASYTVHRSESQLKPNILAPGTVILANGELWEGTSFAAPTISAVLALLGPSLGFLQAAQLIQQSALTGFIAGSSVGVLDIEKAWEVASSAGAFSNPGRKRGP